MYVKRFRRRRSNRRYRWSRNYFNSKSRNYETIGKPMSSKALVKYKPAKYYTRKPTTKQRIMIREWSKPNLRGGNRNQTKEWEMIPPLMGIAKTGWDLAKNSRDIYNAGKDMLVGAAQEAAIRGLEGYALYAPQHFKRNVVDRVTTNMPKHF